MLVAGVLTDMAGYGSEVLSPLDDALRNVESALRSIRGARAIARAPRGRPFAFPLASFDDQAAKLQDGHLSETQASATIRPTFGTPKVPTSRCHFSVTASLAPSAAKAPAKLYLSQRCTRGDSITRRRNAWATTP